MTRDRPLTVLLTHLILSVGARAALAVDPPAQVTGEPPKELLENLDFFEAMDLLKDPKVFDLVSNDPTLADHISSGAEDPPPRAPSDKKDNNPTVENSHENP